ncbi:MAG: hypothetical protein AB7E95_07745 [Kiritimatiellales bacterium]
MYSKLIIAILIGMALLLLSEGLPGLTVDISNLLPSRGHSSQYNLIFWLMVMITIIALLQPRSGGQP